MSGGAHGAVHAQYRRRSSDVLGLGGGWGPAVPAARWQGASANPFRIWRDEGDHHERWRPRARSRRYVVAEMQNFLADRAVSRVVLLLRPVKLLRSRDARAVHMHLHREGLQRERQQGEQRDGEARDGECRGRGTHKTAQAREIAV